MKYCLFFLFGISLFLVKPVEAVTKADFPNARHGVISEIIQDPNYIGVYATLDGFFMYSSQFQDADCYNDNSEYHELYNASDGNLVLSTPQNLGYGLCLNRATGDAIGLSFPPFQLPSGKYWIHYSGANNTSEWVSDDFTLIQPTTIPTPSPTPINHAPSAVIATSIDTNGKLQLDGSLCSDADNDPLTYQWQIDNEPKIRSGKIVSLEDLPTGTYGIKLVVSDSHLSATDASKVGISAKSQISNMHMKLENINLNKTTGDFIIKGSIDTSSQLFKTVLTNPVAKVMFALQTDKKGAAPLFGIIGEDSYKLTTIGKILK